MAHDRFSIATIIAARLEQDREALAAAWRRSAPVPHVVIDDLLPVELAESLPVHFPNPSELMLRSSIRERKRVGVQVDRYEPIVGEGLYAFQQPSIIAAVAGIVGQDDLVGDPSLYAAGISVMAEGDFLNPHVDNSHDGDGRYYRAVNLLYYTSSDWNPRNGGNLELWDTTITEPTTVECRFNRLVLMYTDDRSWHSVSKVTGPQPRLCFSNYFFSPTSPAGHDYRHVTTFTGRPEERMKRVLLKVTDGVVLNAVGRHLPALTKRTKHRIKTPVR